MMRILVAGLGSIGKRHLKICRQCFPDAELFAISSRGVAEAPDIGVEFILLQHIEEAISKSLIFAIVATPASCHGRFVAPLAVAGIPVLVEKPLAHSLVACEELTESLPADHHVGLAYQFRFSPSVQKLKSYIDQSVLGRLLHVQIVTGQYLPDWRPDIDYRNSVSAQKELGGGVIRELSHELDLILWLLGRPNRLSASVINSGSLEINCEDQLDAIFHLPGAVSVNLHLDMLQQDPQRYWLLTGTAGSVKLDLIQQQIQLISSANKASEQHSLVIERDELYSKQLLAFVSYLSGNSVWSGASLADGVTVLELVETLEAAAEQQRWLDFQ